MEHPEITRILLTGYPHRESGFENMVQQTECCGVDFYGTELLEGDEICIDKSNFHEIVLKENLTQYLVDKCDFAFSEVRGMGVVLDQQRLTVFAGQDLEKMLQEEYGFEFTIA
jgi:hypothetical protein